MKCIPLTQGQIAVVDDADFERLSKFKWHAHFNRSTQRFIAERHLRCERKEDGKWKSVSQPMHRDIIQGAAEIDHRNLETLDNRRENLRACTRKQNAQNRRKRHGTKLPFKSIFVNRQGRFTVRLVINGARRSVGTFKTLLAAAAAYNAAASVHYGEFARLNQIRNGGLATSHTILE